MDYSELTPNPIIFFASFLIFLSYIYSKLQPSYRSVEKEHYHEGYALQEHYLPNGPQVYKTHAQERPPFFFEEAYNQNFARPQFSQNIQPTKDFGNNFVQYKPYQNGQQKIDESISYDESWPSREPDLHFPDVSAIHVISKIREAVLSPNNSSFDYPFIENKNVMKDEFNIPESKSSMSLEIPAKDLKDSEKNQRSPMRVPNPRRGPVYDSSDTDTEQRPRKQNGYAENVNEDAMEIVYEKGVPHDKRKYEDYKNKDDSMNKSNRLNETDYEPGLRKKVQEHVVGANIPNGKTVMIQSEGIRVKEIYDYPSRSSSKKGKDQKSKEEASKKKDKSADIKRQGRMEEESRFSKKDFLNRSISLDDSYSEGYSNQSLKKYVAKKTVQEQAFRGKDNVSSGDLKAVIGQKASVVSAVSTASTGSGDLFGKTDTSSTQKSSGLFSNVAQPKNGEPDILTKAIAEKNQANTTASTSDTEKKPASSLFSNLTSTSQDQKKTTTEDANKGQNSVSKSLFGDSGSTTSSLFGPGTGASKPTTSNTSTTVQASTEEPKLSKTESTIQPTSTQTQEKENKGIPRVNASSDLFKNSQAPQNAQNNQPAPSTESTTKSLFGNLAPPSQGNGSGASQTITNAQPEKKDEPAQAPTSTLFGNSASSLFTNAAAPNQTEEKKAPSSGLFGGLASNQTSAPSSSETKASSGTSSLFMPSQTNTQVPTQTESKKEEPKPSLFGGLTSGSSGLFGPNTSSPQKNPAPTSNSSINASPAAGLFTNAAKQSEQTAPQQTSNVVGGKSSFLNQSPSENKPPAAGSIFANFKSAVEKKPETGTSSGTGLFNNNSNVGDNKSTSESLFGKPTSDKPSGGAGGTLFNNNQSNLTNTTDNAPKAGGLFGNLASGGGGSGLFGNVQSKPSGSGLFGNNANTGSSVTSSLFGNK